MTNILILSYHKDQPSIEIHAALKQRGVEVCMLDPGDFPQRLKINASIDSTGTWSGSIIQSGKPIELGEVRSILYRRPTHYQISEALPEQVRSFADNEANKGFGGLLRSLDCFWISHPDALRAAAYKPHQLREAAKLGFSIPATLITNDPLAIRRFYEKHGGAIIYKTLHGGNIGVDEKQYDAIYTSKVTQESLEHVHRVQYTAHLFQEWVEKSYELRITIVGNRVFTARINSHSDAARMDFRSDYENTSYEVFHLPAEIEQRCLALTRRFRLQYSAIDMAVTADGRYVFFELNPVGQYHWIEYYTGLNITEALVDLLIKGAL